jgi:lysozyme
MRSIMQTALDLIKRFEGFRARPYLCPAKIPTIGYGSTHYEDGHKVTLKDAPVDNIKASNMLNVEALRCGVAVMKLVNVPLTDGQYGALVSFVYNLGSGRLQASTLRRKLNRRDYNGAAREFSKWCYGGGRKLKGLELRRKAETNLFLKK